MKSKESPRVTSECTKKGHLSSINGPEIIDKNDHVISWNKDLLSQVSWIEKDTRDFSTFLFLLTSAEMSLDLRDIHRSNDMAPLNNIFFKKNIWCKFQLHGISKIKI